MNKRLPFGVFAILLVVLLAGVGVAYGLWSESLTIDGTVHTGEVDVGLSKPIAFEWVEINGKHQLEPKGKDPYAECAAVATSTDPSDGNETITVTVTGAYPSYHCAVKFDVTNLGSVPVRISQITPVDDEMEWIETVSCYRPWEQLHQGDKAWAWLLIHFTNYDGVVENSQYTFEYAIEARQWNEAPATGMGALAGGECEILPPGLEFPTQ